MRRTIIAACALVALAGCAQQQASQIATVDISRLTSNWPKFINYNNQLASDTEAIQRSNDSARQKAARIAALRQRYLNMQTEVTGDVRDAVEQVANQRHFKLVVTHEFVGYGGVDITPDVEKILQIVEKATPTP